VSTALRRCLPAAVSSAARPDAPGCNAARRVRENHADVIPSHALPCLFVLLTANLLSVYFFIVLP
jgi:hypothetical protein